MDAAAVGEPPVPAALAIAGSPLDRVAVAPADGDCLPVAVEAGVGAPPRESAADATAVAPAISADVRVAMLGWVVRWRGVEAGADPAAATLDGVGWARRREAGDIGLVGAAATAAIAGSAPPAELRDGEGDCRLVETARAVNSGAA